MLTYVDRRGTDSFKWDGLMSTYGDDDLLPLWVADMDFKVDDSILEAMRRYIDTGIPGYYKVPSSYYEAFIDWEKKEHRLDVDRSWIRFTPGVVSGFHMAVQALTEPGDAVIITTPVYYPFMRAVENTGRRLVTSDLVNRDGRYYVDFDGFEELIKANDVRAFIFCSPHNPVSRVWSEGEIRRLLNICRRHNVAVISDEIHHDLVFGGFEHRPTLTAAEPGDRIIMLTAASKTFNIAGLQNSFAVMSNEDVREAWDRLAGSLSISNGNPLGYIATEAAYRHGGAWLEEVRDVIYSNYEYIRDAFAESLPDVRMTPLEGTYLAWADFGAYLATDELEDFMQKRCGLAFDYGSWFGGSSCATFIRINLATSRDNIEKMVGSITANLKEKAGR